MIARINDCSLHMLKGVYCLSIMTQLSWFVLAFLVRYASLFLLKHFKKEEEIV
jgi:hypothetical protein